MLMCLLLCLVQLSQLLLQAVYLFSLNFESLCLIFLGVSLLMVLVFFVCFGDDVMIGEPALKDVESKDCDSMLDPDVDGMDDSDILSAIKGLVDMFSVESLLSSPFGIEYILVDELFGFEQDGQVHVSSLLPRLLNSVVDIPMQFLCVHLSPSSQAIDSVLHAF
jgi:hypothetical protein